MKQKDKSIPVDDADQFIVPPVPHGKRYLGDATTVHKFVGDFANDVMRAYDGFLSAKIDGFASQKQIEALVHEYGEAFMGRDRRYEIAPWQGERMRWRIMEIFPNAKKDADPGYNLFKFIAIGCCKVCRQLAQGYDEDEVGEDTKKLLDYMRTLILTGTL